MQLGETEHERQRRDEDDPAADAEEPGQHAAEQPDRDRDQTRSSYDQPDADGGEHERRTLASRCTRQPLLQVGAQQHARASPAGPRAPRRRLRPARARRRSIAPAIAAMPIAASEVAIGRALGRSRTSSRSGTTTIPPPTPKSALKNPATRPITSELAARAYPRARCPTPTRSAGSPRSPSGPRSSSMSTGCSRRSSPNPADATVPEETRARARAARPALRARRLRQRPPGRGRPDGSSASTGLVYVGEHGLELEPEAEAWVGRLHAFARRPRWPVGAQAR